MQTEHEERPEGTDWRHMVAAGLYQSGLLRAMGTVSRYCEFASDNGEGERLRRVRRSKHVVLGYHSVGAHNFPMYCRLPRKVFAGQMNYIRRHYRVISLRQMMQELQDPGGDPKPQSVVVTFDDGYLGTYTDAFPILKEYEIPATVYLTAGSVETGELAWYDQIFLRFQRATSDVTLTFAAEKTFRLTDFASRVEAAAATVGYLRTIPDNERQRWCESFASVIPVTSDELSGSMMTWEQIREMRDAGISFGCHTMTHPVISRLAPDALMKEVGDSKRLIESRLDAAVEDFAFPFGKAQDCGNVGADPLWAIGFRTAMTAIVGVNECGMDRFRLRRAVQGNELSVAMFVFRLQRLIFRPLVAEEFNATPVAACV